MGTLSTAYAGHQVLVGALPAGPGVACNLWEAHPLFRSLRLWILLGNTQGYSWTPDSVLQG